MEFSGLQEPCTFSLPEDCKCSTVDYKLPKLSGNTVMPNFLNVTKKEREMDMNTKDFNKYILKH